MTTPEYNYCKALLNVSEALVELTMELYDSQDSRVIEAVEAANRAREEFEKLPIPVDTSAGK